MTANPTSQTVDTPRAAGRGAWKLLSALRITIGFYFLWAFIDKMFGLGFATCRDADTGAIAVGCERAWIQGGRITEGYLGSSTGPFADFFAGLGAHAWTDWFFMLGLGGVGIALILGIGTRIGMWSGIALLVMMYVSHAWPTQGGNVTNPFVDEHLIYSVAIAAAVQIELGRQSIGLGAWWRNLSVVQKNRWLV